MIFDFAKFPKCRIFINSSRIESSEFLKKVYRVHRQQQRQAGELEKIHSKKEDIKFYIKLKYFCHCRNNSLLE